MTDAEAWRAINDWSKVVKSWPRPGEPWKKGKSK